MFDLRHFGGGEGRAGGAFGVVGYDCVVSFFTAVLGDEKARGFWERAVWGWLVVGKCFCRACANVQDEKDLEKRGPGLEQ